jgi:uncharacterized protein (TIGR02118 family)
MTPWPRPGLIRRDISKRLDEALAGVPPRPLPGDVESAWFETERDLLATHNAKSLADLINEAGELRFIVRERQIFPEHPIPVPRHGIRLISFFRRAVHMDVAAFESYWRYQHGPIVGRTPRLKRYSQNHLVSEYRTAARLPWCDGITEIWFDSVEDLRIAWASKAMQEEQFDDSAKFIGHSDYYSLVAPTEILERQSRESG